MGIIPAKHANRMEEALEKQLIYSLQRVSPEIVLRPMEKEFRETLADEDGVEQDFPHYAYSMTGEVDD